MSPERPRTAPRWLWAATAIASALMVVFAVAIVAMLVGVDADTPHGGAYLFLSALIIIPPAGIALVLLLLAGLQRRRRGMVVPVLLTASLSVSVMVLAPVVVVALVPTSSPDRPDRPDLADNRATADDSVVVWSYVSGPDGLVPVESRYWSGLQPGHDTIDAALSDLQQGTISDIRPPEGARNFWAAPCSSQWALKITVGADRVVVRLGGPARRDLGRCELSPHETGIRWQQLAWSVRANLDHDVVVRVEDEQGVRVAAVTPDPAYLAS